MAQIQVNPSRVAAAAGAIRDASQAIDAALAELTAVAAVLGASWSGDAQTAFAAAQRRFDAAMTAKADLIDEVSKALDALASSYSAADLAGQRALGGS